MFRISCTAKLIKRASLLIGRVFHEPTTALGNWHANILYFHHLQLLMFVNDTSRLVVITPAQDMHSLANHLVVHLPILLERLAIPPLMIDAEIDEMAMCYYGPTQSRSVLGTMNDYRAQMVALMRDQSTPMTPLEWSLNLNETPIGPLHDLQPGEVVQELFTQRFDVLGNSAS